MKAVIMAGGEGSRLRPLTCDLPKPMAPLCGRPALEHILDLLRRHGVDEAALTLRYLPKKVIDYFDEHPFEGIKLHFVEEDVPLGTAGGVKNAAAGRFDDPFVVISGDALCGVDLTAAMQVHKKQDADATIVVTHVRDPREYGLCVTDAEGYVTGFVEKPDWTQASTDAANTGIYILNPEILRLIPGDRPFDFASNLFPLMLAEGRKIAVYETADYWCDIGDLGTYLSCQRDMLSGAVAVALPPEQKQNIYSSEELPAGDYKLFPPVYLGSRVRIGQGAVVGPDAVLGDGVAVGEGARVRSSVVLNDVLIGDGARLTGAVVCAGASIKKGGALFEGATLGAGAVVGEHAEIAPGVSIWPGKQVADGAKVNDNLQYGGAKRELFDDQGITGEAGVEMTPEFCARLGAAAGSLHCGSRVGVGCGDGCDAKAFKAAFSAGVLSTGARVWDFGRVLESQMSFGVSFCSLDVGFYITGGPKCCVKVLGEGGLPASRPLERELQGHLARGEFIRCAWSSYRDIADMAGVRMLYQQELYRCAPEGLAGVCARPKCLNREGERLFEDTLSRLGCDVSRGPLLHLSECGTKLSVTDEDGEFIPPERILALCALHEFKEGRDVALPSDAPQTIGALAEKYGRKVHRYLSCPADQRDAEARRISCSQLWLRDGIMLGIRLLVLLRSSGQTLRQLLSEVPRFATVCRAVELKCSPGVLLGEIRGAEPPSDSSGAEDGVVIRRQEGHLLLRPSKRGQALRIIAEAATEEIADELVNSMMQRLK